MSSSETASEPALAQVPLRAGGRVIRFRLEYRGSERRLSVGEHLIGRSPDCSIVLQDPLVSRHHAILRVEPDAVFIEDLRSRNGVLVNGEAVVGVRALTDGDELLIVGHKLKLAAGAGKSGFSTTAPMAVATKPAEMFGVLGALADKALAMGHAQEAQRLLGTHLDNVLSQLTQGQRPEDPTLRHAIVYGARLASATHRGYWYGYVFRVLTQLGEVCPAHVLDELYAGASRADGTDLQAIRDYIHSQKLAQDSMTPRERFLLNRVEGLERLLSA